MPLGVTFWGDPLFPVLLLQATANVKMINRERKANADGATFIFGPVPTSKMLARIPSAPNRALVFCHCHEPGGRGRAAIDPVVTTIRATVAVAPFGATGFGVKMQLAPVGSPAHANVMAPFWLGTDATVIVNMAD